MQIDCVPCAYLNGKFSCLTGGTFKHREPAETPDVIYEESFLASIAQHSEFSD